MGKVMSSTVRPEARLLLVGDILFLTAALFGTLFVRNGVFPDQAEFFQHLVPFSLLFVISTLVFHIAGLYDKHTLFFKSKLASTIFFAQLANIFVAALFFFLVPYFGIQPKTNLFLYLVLSTGLVSFWRLYVFPLMSRGARVQAILIADGADADDVFHEVNNNNRYALRFSARLKPTRGDANAAVTLVKEIEQSDAMVIVLPFSDLALLATHPDWDALVFSGRRFIDFSRFYEELFDRVPLATLDYRSLLEEGYRAETLIYTYAKRVTDIVISSVALLVLSPLMLLVALLLKFGESRAAVIRQERVGKGGKKIRIIKFRTMLFDDAGDPEKQKLNRVTTFGKFLRKSQIDEVPQFINVIMGDLSLIGPRPEIPALTKEYEKAIPFYHARHMIQPGISGWAQIKHASPPKWAVDVDATRHKLSYDLYYLKNRSFLIDLSIALQTVKILLKRAGI